MGDVKKSALRVGFDRKLKLELNGAKITSDAGLLLYRELDEAMGLTPTVPDILCTTGAEGRVMFLSTRNTHKCAC